MKSMMLLLHVLFMALAASAPAFAGEPPGRSSALEARPSPNISGLTQVEIEGDLLVKKHCTGCHSESRILNALQSMHSDQNQNYEKEVKNIISRKIRLSRGDISRQDGRTIMEYLVWVWQRQKS